MNFNFIDTWPRLWITTTYDTVPAYICPKCSAIVTERTNHKTWHENEERDDER